MRLIDSSAWIDYLRATDTRATKQALGQIERLTNGMAVLSVDHRGAQDVDFEAIAACV